MFSHVVAISAVFGFVVAWFCPGSRSEAASSDFQRLLEAETRGGVSLVEMSDPVAMLPFSDREGRNARTVAGKSADAVAIGYRDGVVKDANGMNFFGNVGTVSAVAGSEAGVVAVATSTGIHTFHFGPDGPARVGRFATATPTFTALDFSEGGLVLAAAKENLDVQLFDGDDLTELGTFSAPVATYNSVLFDLADDGKTLARYYATISTHDSTRDQSFVMNDLEGDHEDSWILPQGVGYDGTVKGIELNADGTAVALNHFHPYVFWYVKSMAFVFDAEHFYKQQGFHLGWMDAARLAFTSTHTEDYVCEFDDATSIIDRVGGVERTLPVILGGDRRFATRIDSGTWIRGRTIVDLETGTTLWQVPEGLRIRAFVPAGHDYVVVVDEPGDVWWSKWR